MFKNLNRQIINGTTQIWLMAGIALFSLMIPVAEIFVANIELNIPIFIRAVIFACAIPNALYVIRLSKGNATKVAHWHNKQLRITLLLLGLTGLLLLFALGELLWSTILRLWRRVIHPLMKEIAKFGKLLVQHREID